MSLVRGKFTRYRVFTYLVISVLCWFSVRWIGGANRFNLLGTAAIEPIYHYDDKVQSEIEAVWKRIETTLAKHDRKYVDQLGPPATDEELALLETELGYRIPGELRASLQVHAGSEEFLSNFKLYNVSKIEFEWSVHVDISTSVVTEPLCPTPAAFEDFAWHPGWIPVAGWDVYHILINVETGEVCHWDKWNATPQTGSWKRWLEVVAERLESGEYCPLAPGDSMWEGSDDYWTPGSEEKN